MLQNNFFADSTGASLSGIIISKCSEGFCSIDAAASSPELSGVNTPVDTPVEFFFWPPNFCNPHLSFHNKPMNGVFLNGNG